MFAILIVLQIVGGQFDYTVARGDSLTGIGARYGVDVRVIAEANTIRVSAPLQEGQTLKLDNRHIVPELRADTIVVNIPQRMLFYMTLTLPVAAGRKGWETPRGEFEIAVKEPDPVWDVPASIQLELARQGKPVVKRVPPGPQNPLGRYWIGLSIPGIGIHGTNAPKSIFGLQTHGCIRLHPEDIETLFAAVEIGTRGIFIYEPALITASGDAVFVEVHPDAYRAGKPAMTVFRAWAEKNNALDRIDWDRVSDAVRKRDGVARDVTASGSH